MRRERTENLDDMNSSRRDFITKVGTALSHPANFTGYVLTSNETKSYSDIIWKPYKQ